MIDVPKQEIVNGTIPVTGVLVPSDGIPPVTVEPAIGEACHFGQDVENAFPDQIPC